MAQLVVSRHSRRFLEKLPVLESIMRAWEFRDPPADAPPPNPTDPRPHFALEEMLATLLACIAQSPAGREMVVRPSALATAIHFMSLPTVTARDVCVTTMAAIVRPQHGACDRFAMPHSCRLVCLHDGVVVR